MSWNKNFSDERRDMEKVKPWIIGKLRLDNLEEANLQQQREEDIDFIGTRKNRTILIEVKIRYKAYEDFLLETISNITTKSKGWIYRCKAELLTYMILENNILNGTILIMPKLRQWWVSKGIYQNYTEKLGKTNGIYKTSNRAIPWKDIPQNIIIYTKNYNAINEYFQDNDYEYLTER